jgi:colanic acid/amylovoran biosynthesis glycosyltransferase
MRQPLRVLMYHRILPTDGSARCSPSVVSASPAAFRDQMRLVAARYRVLPADEIIDRLSAGRALPERALLITFDDGCRDFADTAWPILRQFRLPATIFVPTAYAGCASRSFWWDRLYAAASSTRLDHLRSPIGRLPLATPDDRRASLRQLRQHVKSMPHAPATALVDELCRAFGEHEPPPPSDVLGWNALRALAADGVTIGAHTRTHPALTRLPLEEARAEIRLSADDLMRELGKRPRAFAYPFGDHDDRVVQLVREEGFELAVTTLTGINWLPGSPVLRLRRTSIGLRTTPNILRARLTAVGGVVDAWRRPKGHRASGADAADASTAEAAAGLHRVKTLKVGYLMSRFPKLSETFVLNEIAACAEYGVPVEVFPLLRERQSHLHPEAADWVRRARFHPFLSPSIVAANVRALYRHPVRFLTLAAEVLRGTFGSLNFLVGALGIFPKTVRIAEEMREAGVTHVHAHFATHPALAALIVNRLTGIPFSFTAHGSDLHVNRRMLDTKVDAARFVVTVSEYNRDVIVRECGERALEKVHVIHCGVDPCVFRPKASQATERHGFRVVCVASLEEVKGHRYLVEACRLLRERGVGFQCHLVGEGPRRRDVERQVAAAGLGQDVVFHGGLPRPAVLQLLMQADAAVLASHPTRSGKREGIPVALMEAMACGLPVVATAISGIPELVENGVSGLLVPSAAPVALADALEHLAKDPALCANLGSAGRLRVETSFNLRRCCEELLRRFGAAHADGPLLGALGTASDRMAV